jgi:hypothetical protein
VERLVDLLGENGALAALGGVVGIAFGFFAQRSCVCLRSAVIEFARGHPGGKLTVWLFTFATAVCATQALTLAGAFDARGARQIAARGSLSGAAIFTVTSWVTLCAMWGAAALADRLFDRRPSGALDQPVPGSAGLRPGGVA